MRIRREEQGKSSWQFLGGLFGGTPAPPTPFTVDRVYVNLRLFCEPNKAFFRNPVPDLCAKSPIENLKLCESQKLTTNCYDVVVQGVQKNCKDHSGDPACKWLNTITTLKPAVEQHPTEIQQKTTAVADANNLPLIIGGIVGVVALIIIGVVIFICCRKKKNPSAPGQSMAGTTGGGSTTASLSRGRTANGIGPASTNTAIQN